MALLSPHRRAVQYESDDGTTYKVTAMYAVASQTAAGGVVAVGTEPTYPQKWKERKGVFRTTDLTPNVSREVTIYTQAAYAALATGDTINLNHGTDSHTFVFTDTKTGEVIDKRDVTIQVT
jgi:hypothetical protein